MPPPLTHVRVVDLTDLRGALCGRMLADLGADVLLVEPPDGHPDRRRPPFAGDVVAPDRSLPFLFRHANKRGLRTALDGPRLHALCDDADVVVENFAPDERARYDLAPDAVARRHPSLIHVAIADCGLHGPRADWRLEPLAAFAASGALHASGFPDRPPCWLPGYLAHDCAAIAAAGGAVAALLARARDGRGQTVEVSVEEAALGALDPWAIPLPDYARRWPVLPTELTRDADGPALVLPTADGFVRTLAVTPRQWRAFAALLANRPAATHSGEPRVDATWGALPSALAALADEVAALGLRALAQLPLGKGAVPALQLTFRLVRAIASEALRPRSRADVLAHALALGLPMAPVHTPEEFVDAAQTVARGYFVRPGFPHLGGAPVAPFPCRLSRTPALLARAAPDGTGDAAFPSRAAAPAPDDVAPVPPLAGLRVIDFGVGAVAPQCGRALAELGAEVVKIESRSHPDFLRRLAVEPGSLDASWMFADESRGHASVALDLGTPEGRALALQLCARADVVLENRQGGLLARWGLDEPDVRAVRPDVVYVSSQGYGRGGPLGTAPAFGPLNAAFAGASFLWNHPDAPYPAGSSLEHPDHLAGRLAAVAVLAALEHRRRTGEGQHIELAQTEATAYLLGEFYLEHPCTGRPARPAGNAVPYACPHGVYPAAGDDRWLALAVVGDAAWARFRGAVGWPDDARLTTLDGRLAARAQLDDRVAVWTRSRDAHAAAAHLQAAGVSAMAVQRPSDLRADPHLAVRAAFVTLDDPAVPGVQHVASPLRLSRSPLVAARPAPRLGGDTAAVLTRLLGLDDAALAALAARGVIGT